MNTVTCIKRWHVEIPAATRLDCEVSDTLPVAGRLRVTIEVAQLSIFLTITVWRRQVPLLQNRYATEKWLRVTT